MFRVNQLTIMLLDELRNIITTNRIISVVTKTIDTYTILSRTHYRSDTFILGNGRTSSKSILKFLFRRLQNTIVIVNRINYWNKFEFLDFFLFGLRRKNELTIKRFSREFNGTHDSRPAAVFFRGVLDKTRDFFRSFSFCSTVTNKTGKNRNTNFKRFFFFFL